MRSLSKLVKSSQIIIDDKKYILTNEFFVPTQGLELSNEDDSDEIVNEEMVNKDKDTYFEELRQMKEEMLEDVKQNADKLLGSAMEEKTKLIQEGFEEVDRIKNEAKTAGYEAGFEAGIEKGYQEVADLIDENLIMKEKYQTKYNQIKEESEEAITSIILETVSTILNKHVEEDESLIADLAKKALEKCAFTSNLSLRVSPEDYDNAVSMERYLLSLTENIERIDIKQDNALKPGSCIFDTDAGSVDSGVLTQFEKVRQKFEELLKSE